MVRYPITPFLRSQNPSASLLTSRDTSSYFHRRYMDLWYFDHRYFGHGYNCQGTPYRCAYHHNRDHTFHCMDAVSNVSTSIMI